MPAEGPGKISVTDVGSYTVAKTTQLNARKVMAYAASINDTNEAYFNDLRQGGLRVHPAISFSLQWNARFLVDQTVNVQAAPFGVHAETDLRIYRPFKLNEVVKTQGRLVARKQIGPGVYSVDRYKMTNEDGELLAELDYNGIIRGGELDGANIELEPDIEKPVCSCLPDPPVWSEAIYIGVHAGQQYTECADIYNPIHTESSVAKRAGLPGVILHGSATKAHALTQVINHCFGGDANRIRRLCGQLRGMVLMDSTISVECMAVQQTLDEKQVFFRVLNDAGQAAIANGVVCGTPDS